MEGRDITCITSALRDMLATASRLTRALPGIAVVIESWVEAMAMTYNGVEFDPSKIADFCRRHRVHRLSLFGSILRDDFGPDSDVDVLVEFQPGARVSLFDLGGMIMELRDMLGRDVDLRTAADLSKYFRDEVVAGARPLYAA